VEQKESTTRAELKRCIIVERRWNRNEVSRESADKEVDRRPTSLKNFTADALRGRRVSIATNSFLSLLLEEWGRVEEAS